jgi:hypothetical protein
MQDDEIGEIRRMIVEPTPAGPREIGIGQRTVLRPGKPPFVQRFDPPIPEGDLPPLDRD